MQDKQAIKQTLEEEARRCQWLVLWLNCDREGENIAYEVIEVCTGANSHLNIWRARFSALIDRYWFLWVVLFPLVQWCHNSYSCPIALSKKHFSWNCREIHESVQHLGRPNKLFADAVDARQVIRVCTNVFNYHTNFKYCQSYLMYLTCNFQLSTILKCSSNLIELRDELLLHVSSNRLILIVL